MDVSLSELLELVMDREAWRDAIHGVTKSRTRLRDWTELNWWSNGYARHKDYASEQSRCVSWPLGTYSLLESIDDEVITIKYGENHDRHFKIPIVFLGFPEEMTVKLSLNEWRLVDIEESGGMFQAGWRAHVNVQGRENLAGCFLCIVGTDFLYGVERKE